MSSHFPRSSPFVSHVTSSRRGVRNWIILRLALWHFNVSNVSPLPHPTNSKRVDARGPPKTGILRSSSGFSMSLTCQINHLNSRGRGRGMELELELAPVVTGSWFSSLVGISQDRLEVIGNWLSTGCNEIRLITGKMTCTWSAKAFADGAD